jgi:hypothetical protein
MEDDADRPIQPGEAAAEGTPSFGGDLVGPGTGGTPTGAGTSEPDDPYEAATDPDVAALIAALRNDESLLDDEVREDYRDAAEEAGTGTDA